MQNGKYHTLDVKKRCEDKLDIKFRSGSEFNGWFWLDGKRAARVTVPKGRKPVPRGTYSSMAKQLKISVHDFDEFMDCPLTLEKYIKILKAKGI